MPFLNIKFDSSKSKRLKIRIFEAVWGISVPILDLVPRAVTFLFPVLVPYDFCFTTTSCPHKRFDLLIKISIDLQQRNISNPVFERVRAFLTTWTEWCIRIGSVTFFYAVPGRPIGICW